MLPRSVAQLAVSEEHLLYKLLLDSLGQLLFPPEALQHCKQATLSFLERCESLFGHLLKLTHANRARRFRRLAHVFTDFNVLQHDAWQLDEQLKVTFGSNLRYPRPCWVWITEHCLQMMLAKLFVGFELDLYDPSEFHMIYWYADYLFGLRVYNLNEVYHAQEKKKKGKEKAAVRGGQRPRSPPASLLYLEAMQSSVRGLFRLLAYCIRENLIKSAADGLAQRFVLRFRSLEQFRLPHLPSFKDFEQSSASAQAPVESRLVLEAAQASFTEASQALDRMVASKDNAVCVSKLKRVVVANQLAITVLLRGKACKVSVSSAHHPHFVSVQVNMS